MTYPCEFWNNRYDDPNYTYGTLPNHFFKTELDAISKPGRLLLLAEGEGRNAVYAAEKGWKVTAVDFSKKAKEKALALAKLKGVTIDYHVTNIQSFDFDKNGPWDVIGLIYAHFPPEIRADIHHKCAESLRPGGKIILEAFNRRQVTRVSGGPKDFSMLYAKRQLEKDFKGLDIVMSKEVMVYLAEGEGHEGLGEVVRVVGELVK